VLIPVLSDDLTRAALPSAAMIKDFADELEALEQRLEDLDQEIGQVRTDLAEKTAERHALLATEDAVPPERLRAVREHRNRGWALVRRQIEGDTPDLEAVKGYSGGVSLAEAVEVAITEADDVADHRFEAAEASARLSLLGVDITRLETGIDARVGRIEEARTKRDHLLRRWQEAWSGSGLVPETPAAMAGWLVGVEEVENLRHDLRRFEDQVATDRATREALRARLVTALIGQSGCEPAATDDFVTVLKTARNLESELTKRELEREQAAKNLADKEDDAAEAARGVDKAGHALDQWRSVWARTMTAVNRPAESHPADVGAFIDAWDAIREADDKAQDLRHRIKRPIRGRSARRVQRSGRQRPPGPG
jgi:uncharacterized protein YhaN